MIFIYNNTDEKIGLSSKINDSDSKLAEINLVIGEDKSNSMTIANAVADNIIQSIQKMNMTETFEELRHNPFKTEIFSKGRKTVYIPDDNQAPSGLLISDFDTSDIENSNGLHLYPRAVIFVITGLNSEVYMDSRSLYSNTVSEVVGNVKVTRLVIKYGKWSSLKIRTFISIKDGESSKKIQLRGLRRSVAKDSVKREIITNSLQVSDMTDEEYEVIKSGKIPTFGRPSVDPEKTDEKLETQKVHRKKIAKHDDGEDRPPYYKKNHGYRNDVNRENNSRKKHFKGNGAKPKFNR